MLRGQILKAPRSRLGRDHDVDEVKVSGTVLVFALSRLRTYNEREFFHMQETGHSKPSTIIVGIVHPD